MNSEYNVLSRFLKCNGYFVNETKLEIEYLSHPDRPDLISYCDTLNLFNIEYLAAELTKNNLDNIDNPFIVHLQHNGNHQFCLVLSVSDQKIFLYDGNKEFNTNRENFLEIWDGIVLCIDPNIVVKRSFRTALNPFLIFLASILIFLGESISVWQISYYLLSLLGALISMLIIQKELGLKNKLSEKFCGHDVDSGCNKVIGNNKFDLRGMSIGDISLAYFFSTAMINLIYPWKELNLFLITSFLSIIIVFISITYQSFIAKAWCRLCLVISLILVLQVITSIEFLYSPFSLNASIIYIGLIFIAFVIAIFQIKVFIKKAAVLKELEIENLTFRKNYNLFNAFMKNQPELSCELPNNCVEIKIGSSSAAVELIAISNPMCEPCSKAHELYDELLEKYPEDISLKILFYVPFENQFDPRTQVAAYFLDCINNDCDQNNIKLLLQKWYEGSTTKNDLKLRENIDDNTLNSLRIQKQWCHMNDINQTPTLIINRKKFPSFYKISDLKYYMETCINSSKLNYNCEYISSYNI